jgi:hypothetical protein
LVFLTVYESSLWLTVLEIFPKPPCIFYELFPKRPGKIGPVNFSKTTINCFQNYLEISTSSIFPSSFGNFSCIENALGQCILKRQQKINEMNYALFMYSTCTVF